MATGPSRLYRICSWKGLFAAAEVDPTCCIGFPPQPPTQRLDLPLSLFSLGAGPAPCVVPLTHLTFFFFSPTPIKWGWCVPEPGSFKHGTDVSWKPQSHNRGLMCSTQAEFVQVNWCVLGSEWWENGPDVFQKSFNFTVTLFIARQIKRPHFHIFPSVSAFLFPILYNKETLTSLDMPELFRKVLM